MNNIPEQWIKLHHEYENAEKKDSNIEVIIDINDPDTHDVTNLRYAFLIENTLLHRNPSVQPKLHICIHDSSATAELSEWQKSMLHRIKAFLVDAPNFSCFQFTYSMSPLQQKYKQYIESDQASVSRISPICYVCQPSNSQNWGQHNYQLLKQGYEQNRKQLKTFRYFIEAYQNWFRNPEKYVGTQTTNLSQAEKKQFCDTIWQNFKEHSVNMNLLSMVIWMFILRQLVETKQLFQQTPQKRFEINQSLLNKSRLDAAAYGESMYQLIENACLHSYGHCAWFGFRMYRTNDDKQSRDFLDTLQTRARLYKKYQNYFEAEKGSHNVFAENHTGYFEFYVLDNAGSKGGILQTHAQYVFDKKKEIIRKHLIEQRLHCYLLSQSSTPLSDEDIQKKKQELELTTPCPETEDDAQAKYHDEWVLAEDAARKSDPSLPQAAKSISSLIHQPLGKSVDEQFEQLSTHYGLICLERSVLVNRGYFALNTANKEDAYLKYLNGSEKRIESKDISYHHTEWTVLLPMTYNWPIVTQEEKIQSSYDFFSHLYSDTVKGYSLLNLQPLDLSILKKDKAIELLEGEIKPYLDETRINELCKQVVMIRASDQFQDIEILAKALLHRFLIITKGLDDNLSIRLALLLPSLPLIYEFIRVFSIFYSRGELQFMKQVQLALCAPENQDPQNWQVYTVFTGKTLQQAMTTAVHYTYHYSWRTLEQLPVLSYLTFDSSNKSNENNTDSQESPSIFPFDLCLPSQLPSENVRNAALPDPWKDSWFIHYIRHILESCSQEEAQGCLTKDIHVRLGSKIHLDKYYEADLLFHNTSITLRLANLILYDMLQVNPIDRNQPLLLIGYEKQATPLILHLQQVLENFMSYPIYEASVYSNTKEDIVQVHWLKEPQTKDFASPIQVVSIVPVGTTLSTNYKVLRTILLDLHGKGMNIDEENIWEKGHNYAIFIVGSENTPHENIDAIAARYWKSHESIPQIVTVQPDRYGVPPIRVRYLIMLHAKWHAPENCALCNLPTNQIRPLIDARHSQATASMIFPLYGLHRGNYYRFAPTYQHGSIEELWPYVTYAHIADGHDHYQFYIDFIRLFPKIASDVRASLRDFKPSLGAVNIVISPLHNTNASFVKAVIDEVFGGKAHFLCFDVQDSYREQIRTKFSYICSEYAKLKLINPQEKLHVHFVDNAIVTGNTINRSRVLVKMLLNQAGIASDNTELFENVFLLVNRCSYDTINSFVASEVSEHFYTYINLCVPSYNTDHDSCPACKMVEKYSLLERRSATRQLAKEFARLEEKHKKRTKEEYDAWIDSAILSSPAIYAWTKQWLTTSLPLKKGETKTEESNPDIQLLHYFPELSTARYKQDDVSSEQELQVVKDLFLTLNHYEEGDNQTGTGCYKTIEDQRTIGDAIQYFKKTHPHGDVYWDEAKCQKLVEILRIHLIGTRDFMRLYCMHKAYTMQEEIFNQNAHYTLDTYRDEFIKLLKSDMWLCKKQSNSVAKQYYPWIANPDYSDVLSRYILMHDVEMLISYIKVFSREHLVNHYPIRQVITNFMFSLLDTLESNENPARKRPITQKRNINNADYLSPVLPLIKKLYPPKSKENIEKGQDQFHLSHLLALARYQLNILLIHRLADLQLSNIFSCEHINNYITTFCSCKNIVTDDKTIIFPNENRALMRYLKAIKVATMTIHDEIPCLELAKRPADLQRILEEMKSENVVPSVQQNKQKIPSGTQYTAEMKELLTRLARYLFLENTQFLYTGMQELQKMIDPSLFEELCKPSVQYGLNTKIKALSNEVSKCLKNCYHNTDGQAEESALLYQSVLVNFCRYWHRSRNHSPFYQHDSSNEKVIPYMLMYFRLLEKLFSNDENYPQSDGLPYLYEAICRSICGFTGYHMCYIAYQNSDAFPDIFTQSGYYTEYLRNNKILSPHDLTGLLTEVFDASHSRCSNFTTNETKYQMILPCVTQHTDTNKEIKYLILSLTPNDTQSPNGKFFIVLQTDLKSSQSELQDKDPLQQALETAQKVLFLRKRLQKILLRDYTALINRRFDCSYIHHIWQAKQSFIKNTHPEPIERKERTIEKDCHGSTILNPPAILHLSDLHLTNNLVTDTRCKIVYQYLTDYFNKLNRKTGQQKCIIPELLAITGDVIDGREGNPTKLEANYRAAMKMLTEIVIALWSDNDNYLTHDWKRRVMITTGNHDFAAMNQYVAQQKHRALVAGTPTDEHSGTMSRFTYFIDFLIRFLDPPIDKLLVNSLNEVRFYRHLDINVILLNCSDCAMPFRTNKIGVNAAIIKKLTDSPGWRGLEYSHPSSLNEGGQNVGPFKLCLAHYSPLYNLSYLCDTLGALPGWEWNSNLQKNCIANQLVDYFVNVMASEIHYRLSKTENDLDALGKDRQTFCNQFYSFQMAISALEEGKPSPDIEADGFYQLYKKEIRLNSSSSASAYFKQNMYTNELYQKMKLYYDWLNNMNQHEIPFSVLDEKISRLVSEIAELKIVSEEDLEMFKHSIDSVYPMNLNGNETCTQYVDLYLAGHIHAYAEESQTHILIADRMIHEDDNKVYGYLITNLQGSTSSKLTQKYCSQRLSKDI